MSGNENNIAAKWFFELYAKSFPKSFLHPCPFLGELKAYNITADTKKLISTFFTGQYRSTTRFYDEEDDNIFTLILDMELINESRRLID